MGLVSTWTLWSLSAMARRFVLKLLIVPNLAIFFFQAEDGIRDHCVTGVQTCALPISASQGLRAPYRHEHSERERRARRASTCKQSSRPRRRCRIPCRRLSADTRRAAASRSEERRVGKECRSRRTRYHEEKERTAESTG